MFFIATSSREQNGLLLKNTSEGFGHVGIS